MRKSGALILFAVLFVVVAQAELPELKAGSPLDLFDHTKHHTYFSALNTSCELCHKTPDSYSRAGADAEGCHSCHNNAQSPSKKAADFKCITCHKNLESVKPKDHFLNWLSTHQTRAKEDKKGCLKCHQGYFCTACHQQRDTIDQTAHSRNYRYTHSIEARSNPQKCDRCHQVAFCKECHENN